ncbi:hypothetical protein SADUNF_Sadunf17G0089500 [Salix dunnii]|uniref:Uncharacterized protein n=1 Tax=Salix dunnii TaxID=1413687 RepID=A0A835MHF8_9ROSI|nr:hypothetical protein SADUNF_Sadunf17G0089500 [Salix dunnii]
MRGKHTRGADLGMAIKGVTTYEKCVELIFVYEIIESSATFSTIQNGLGLDSKSRSSLTYCKGCEL